MSQSPGGERLVRVTADYCLLSLFCHFEILHHKFKMAEGRINEKSTSEITDEFS